MPCSTDQGFRQAHYPHLELAYRACEMLAPDFADLPVADCTRAVQKAYGARRQAAGIAISTISQTLSVLRSAFKRAAHEGQISHHPAVIEVDTRAPCDGRGCRRSRSA